ncbi:MAG: hypothetical protein H7293_16775 [Candidatus Saccharibacteria bacterium]|nr:hypothetical protein [Rhodoferax sp.]
MNDKDKVKQAQALAHLRENMAATLEFIAWDAEVNRAKYLAYLRNGFSEQQALELCKS